MKTLVIAGNRTEAILWIRKKCAERFMAGSTSVSMSEYVYVSDVNHVRGISNPTGVFVGTWRSRRDILEIVETLVMASPNINPTLQRIRDDLRKSIKLVPVTGGWVGVIT